MADKDAIIINDLKREKELGYDIGDNVADTVFTNKKNIIDEHAAKGAKGDQGIQGIQGIKGDRGIAGIRGYNGTDGDDGAQGIQGDPGPTGPKGDRGLAGIQGNSGPEGAKGDKGDQGPAGGGAGGAALGPNTVGSVELKNGAVTNAKLSRNSVTGTRIRARTITGNYHLALNSVPNNVLTDKTIEANKIKDKTITALQIADGVLGTPFNKADYFTNNAEKLTKNDVSLNPGLANIGKDYKGVQTYGAGATGDQQHGSLAIGDQLYGASASGYQAYGFQAKGLISIGQSATGGIRIGKASTAGILNKLYDNANFATFKQIIDKAKEPAGGGTVLTPKQLADIAKIDGIEADALDNTRHTKYFEAIRNKLNPNALLDSAIVNSKLAEKTITAAKIADKTITALQIADGVIPAGGGGGSAAFKNGDKTNIFDIRSDDAGTTTAIYSNLNIHRKKIWKSTSSYVAPNDKNEVLNLGEIQALGIGGGAGGFVKADYFANNAEKLTKNDNSINPGDAHIGYSYKGNAYYNSDGNATYLAPNGNSLYIGTRIQSEITIGKFSKRANFSAIYDDQKRATFKNIVEVINHIKSHKLKQSEILLAAVFNRVSKTWTNIDSETEIMAANPLTHVEGAEYSTIQFNFVKDLPQGEYQLDFKVKTEANRKYEMNVIGMKAAGNQKTDVNGTTSYPHWGNDNTGSVIKDVYLDQWMRIRARIINNGTWVDIEWSSYKSFNTSTQSGAANWFVEYKGATRIEKSANPAHQTIGQTFKLEFRQYGAGNLAADLSSGSFIILTRVASE